MSERMDQQVTGRTSAALERDTVTWHRPWHLIGSSCR